jgi:hypothetical protein
MKQLEVQIEGIEKSQSKAFSLKAFNKTKHILLRSLMIATIGVLTFWITRSLFWTALWVIVPIALYKMVIYIREILSIDLKF